MTRTVTLTFDDGSSHIYNNVPDEITPEQVQQRASSEFSGKSLVNIDGGNKKTSVGKEIAGVGAGVADIVAPLNMAIGG